MSTSPSPPDKKNISTAGAASGKTALQSRLTDSRKSSLEKYQDLVIGRKGLIRLFFYELLTLFVTPLPGAIGLFLRGKLYPFFLAKVGRGVVFGRSMTIRHPHKIYIGDNTVFDDYSVLDAKGENNSGIKVGRNVMVGRGTVLSCKNGHITIGDNTNIAMNCFIQSAADVQIGSFVLFGAYCYIIGGGDHKTDRIDIPIISQGQVVQGITISDNCWLGGGVMVQDGVTIGSDVIVGSGAVVRDNIEPFSIAAGVPARIKRSRKA